MGQSGGVKSLRILFINSFDDVQSTDKPLRTLEQISFGISYISALLKKHGHNTKLLILSRIMGDKNKKKIELCCLEFQPDLICFTTVASEYEFMSEMASFIKFSYPNIYLLIGGPHVSLNPEGVLVDSFDAVCVGEGEFPVLELVKQLESGKRPSLIANLWLKDNGETEKNPTRPYLQDLDSLPFADREIWLDQIEKDIPITRLPVLVGRGCPFQCTYCCNHALRRLAEGNYVRYRSPANIVAEIKELKTKFPNLKEIYLEVETMAQNKAWAIELCHALEGLELSFGTNIRITPKADLKELFAAFKKANFRFINIGLESGSARLHQEVLKRNYSNQDIIEAVRLAKQNGLKVCFYNMIGFPTETLEDFQETVRINRECLPDWHFTSIFFPYPGTDLYRLTKSQGLLTGKIDSQLERRKAILDLPTFPKRLIQKSYDWFDYYVYKGQKPLYKIILRMVGLKLKANYVSGYLYRQLIRLPILQQLKLYLREY